MLRRWHFIAAVVLVTALAGCLPGDVTPRPGLLERARLGTWRVLSRPNATGPLSGFGESDFLFLNGKYYLFATGHLDPAWVDVCVGKTLEELVSKPPAFTHVAPLRYPSVVLFDRTWHLWGVNPVTRTTEHWTSAHSDPTGFAYADTPFRGATGGPLVDFAVRKYPTGDDWYGIGFAAKYNSPLYLTRAHGPGGPWTRLNYDRDDSRAGIFGDTGAPPWAGAARPDPNLAFTPDGRAWALFTGKAVADSPPAVSYRAGIVELDVETGTAAGNAVALFDPPAHEDLPIHLASDLNLVAAGDGSEQILAYTDSPRNPLAVLTLAIDPAADDQAWQDEVVHLDPATGRDPVTGIGPSSFLAPATWGRDALTIDATHGGVMGFLAIPRLGDLTVSTVFTPSAVYPSALNVVAYAGGLDYRAGPGMGVQIDATKAALEITASLSGSDGSQLALESGVGAQPGTGYSVVLKRRGVAVSLMVNGSTRASGRFERRLDGLQTWSLGAQATLTQSARYPFQGEIRSLVISRKGE